MPIFSTGSSNATPVANLLLTSLTLLSACILASTGLRSLARKMRMCEMPSSVESKTGTTANSPSSLGGQGRTPAVEAGAPFLAGAGVKPVAQWRRTSTMY